MTNMTNMTKTKPHPGVLVILVILVIGDWRNLLSQEPSTQQLRRLLTGTG
jgi:hypothetical protein